MTKTTKQKLVNQFKTPAREAYLDDTNKILVPRLFDDNGDLIRADKVGGRYLLKFNLREAHFLKALRDHDGDMKAACEAISITIDDGKAILKSKAVQHYLKEQYYESQLAQVVSPQWVKAVLTEVALGITDPTDNQKWGIKELKEFVLPKGGPQVQINNIWNTPKLTAEEESKLREMAEKALETEAKDAA